jgi:hypothetical protein
MPLDMQLWPKPEDLGSYYDVWLKMAVGWVIVVEYCQDEPWYLELEREARRYSTSADGILDMVSFIESFYCGLAVYDWHVHRIVRNAMLLF